MADAQQSTSGLILGYEPGEIACEAAFIADFDVASDIPIGKLVTKIDEDRRRMDVRPGMRSKYVPMRFDPATGAHQIGGRYLFRSWADVEDYQNFTANELEFEPGTKFWDRPFFSNISKHAWRVIGADDIIPLERHYASRFERFKIGDVAAADVARSWAAIREAAHQRGLASVWLLLSPDGSEVGLVTALEALEVAEERRASGTLTALEHGPSLSAHLSPGTISHRVFDRTSLNLALWLPMSRRLGGAASFFPTFPAHPRPGAAT